MLNSCEAFFVYTYLNMANLTSFTKRFESVYFHARIAESRKCYSFLLALLILLASSCTKDSFDFSSIHAYFVFDNGIHQDATLQSALNPMSPGVFCRVSEGSQGGSIYFNFESNQGLTSRQKANADDIRRTRIIGIYNMTGIIVGYSNLSTPATFCCYDSQCPNCYAETNMADYKLAINSKGIAKCNKCKREYDLNNNGLAINVDTPSKKLIKYRASCTGPLGVLAVNN